MLITQDSLSQRACPFLSYRLRRANGHVRVCVSVN